MFWSNIHTYIRFRALLKKFFVIYMAKIAVFWPKMCAKCLKHLFWPLNPFQKKWRKIGRKTFWYPHKISTHRHFSKTGILGKVLFLLFLLLFGVPQCCFFKSMMFQLSFAQKIIKKALLDQKLCQFEIWSIPC